MGLFFFPPLCTYITYMSLAILAENGVYNYLSGIVISTR